VSGRRPAYERLSGASALRSVVEGQKRGEAVGVFSVCSAHPAVLETALEVTGEGTGALLVEATSNQVNQEGGYTGVTPDGFAQALRERARAAGLPPERVVFGGDHLGPHPWRTLPASEAMDRARELVRQYVRAGAAKIHLDASMTLGDDPKGPLDDAVAAERSAELGAAAEGARPAGSDGPVYVIGTEVPPPGGERDDAAGPEVTRPGDARRALETTRSAFGRLGLDEAWTRVVALVVQPGVEFGDDRVHDYDPPAAAPLSRFIEGVPGVVFEAHSTDYQRETALRELVRDHFAILKVGPWLTYAYREGVLALCAIEEESLGTRAGVQPSGLREVVDEVMRKDPVHWRGYAAGDEREQRFSRTFGLSDRVRYYWPRREIAAALSRLHANLEAHPPPLTLLSQYLPGAFGAVREGRIANRPRELVRWRVREVIELYARACGAARREG